MGNGESQNNSGTCIEIKPNIRANNILVSFILNISNVIPPTIKRQIHVPFPHCQNSVKNFLKVFFPSLVRRHYRGDRK